MFDDACTEVRLDAHVQPLGEEGLDPLVGVLRATAVQMLRAMLRENIHDT